MAFVNKMEMTSPFFEVRVGPPRAQPSQMITLPTWVHKLIYNFEYSETRNGGEDSASRIILHVTETLNTPGSILDLRLDSESLNFKDAKSVKEGKYYDQTTTQKTLQDDEEITSTSKKQEDEKEKLQKAKQKKIKARFLFQEQNTIEVTFGYRDSKSHLLSARTIRGSILQITHKASESGIPSTEITAVDIGSGEFSKIYPKTGINFTVKQVKDLLNGKISDTSNRGDTAPARIDDIAQAIGTKILENTEVNVDLTPDELFQDLQDKTSSRTWAMGMNLHSFFKKLAEKLFCHYYMDTIIRDGKVKNVLNIVSRSKYEAVSKFHFMWKSGQGSSGIQLNKSNSLIFNTLTNYELQLYPVGGSGGSSTGVNSEKKEIDGSSDALLTLKRPAGVSESSNVLDSVETIKTTDGVADKVDSTGAPVYSATNSNDNHKANANRLAGRMEANLRLSFNTIGIPQLTPQVIILSNIGERYSGTYYLLAVTHTFSPDGGYTCSVVGEGHSVNSGGVKVPAKPVQVETDLAGTIQLKADAGETPVNALDTFTVSGSN